MACSALYTIATYETIVDYIPDITSFNIAAWVSWINRHRQSIDRNQIVGRSTADGGMWFIVSQQQPRRSTSDVSLYAYATALWSLDLPPQ